MMMGETKTGHAHCMKVEMVVKQMGEMVGLVVVMELVVAVMMMVVVEMMLMEVEVWPEAMLPLHPILFQETQTCQWHSHQAGGLGFLEDDWMELHQGSGCQ
jgi:hypothetical protein